jgi:hypothetical protein
MGEAGGYKTEILDFDKASVKAAFVGTKGLAPLPGAFFPFTKLMCFSPPSSPAISHLPTCLSI